MSCLLSQPRAKRLGFAADGANACPHLKVSTNDVCLSSSSYAAERPADCCSLDLDVVQHILQPCSSSKPCLQMHTLWSCLCPTCYHRSAMAPLMSRGGWEKPSAAWTAKGAQCKSPMRGTLTMGMRSKLTDSSAAGPLTAAARPLLSLCLKATSARHATHCPCGQLAEHS